MFHKLLHWLDYSLFFFLFISPCTVLLLPESFCLFVLPYFWTLSSLLSFLLLLSDFGFPTTHVTSPVIKRFLFQSHLFLDISLSFNSDTEHMYANVCKCQHFRFTTMDYLVLILAEVAESGSPLQCDSYSSVSPGSKGLSTYVWETQTYVHIYIHARTLLSLFMCRYMHQSIHGYIHTTELQNTLEAGLRLSVCLEACCWTPGLPSCWHIDTGALEAHRCYVLLCVSTWLTTFLWSTSIFPFLFLSELHRYLSFSTLSPSTEHPIINSTHSQNLF